MLVGSSRLGGHGGVATMYRVPARPYREPEQGGEQRSSSRREQMT